MSGYFRKSADETVSCRIDWMEGYLAETEAIARDLGWEVAAKAGQTPATLHAAYHDGVSSRVQVAKGSAGCVYMLICRALTTTGRTLERAVTLQVV